MLCHKYCTETTGIQLAYLSFTVCVIYVSHSPLTRLSTAPFLDHIHDLWTAWKSGFKGHICSQESGAGDGLEQGYIPPSLANCAPVGTLGSFNLLKYRHATSLWISYSSYFSVRNDKAYWRVGGAEDAESNHGRQRTETAAALKGTESTMLEASAAADGFSGACPRMLLTNFG